MNAETHRDITHTYAFIALTPIYDNGLGGIPVRCEECDGITGSCGLSPPITQQYGLVLISLWKHQGWKWSRKQQVAQRVTQANPEALECVQSLAFINTNAHLCLVGSYKHSITPFVSWKRRRLYQYLILGLWLQSLVGKLCPQATSL